MRPERPREQAESPAAFPAVDGRTLLGANVALPADFPADRTLTVVAFQRGQQSLVDRWIERAVAAGVPPTPRGASGSVPVAVVEVPVLSTRWRPVRRFIDGGMTAGIGDPDVLARTITVYTDVAAFQRFVAIPGSDDVHALVVDRDGTILARGCGDPDDESWAAIAAGLLVD
ncbi:MAG TPA: roadblock/LC7 domain-containing protein [Dermatophilaceae bacterium]